MDFGEILEITLEFDSGEVKMLIAKYLKEKMNPVIVNDEQNDRIMTVKSPKEKNYI